MIVMLFGAGLCLYGSISAFKDGDNKKGVVNLAFAALWLFILLAFRK